MKRSGWTSRYDPAGGEHTGRPLFTDPFTCPRALEQTVVRHL